MAFYVNLPVGVLAVAFAARLLQSDQHTLDRRPFDFVGFVLVSPGLVAFLYGLEKATRGGGFGALAVGIALLTGFVVHARRARTSALVDLQLFESGLFANAALSQFLANGMIYASQFLVPLYLITGAGLSPSRVGWLLAPAGIAMMFVYPLMGTVTDRFGCRAVVVSGVLLTVFGTLPFIWMTQRGFTSVGVVLGLILRPAIKLLAKQEFRHHTCSCCTDVRANESGPLGHKKRGISSSRRTHPRPIRSRDHHVIALGVAGKRASLLRRGSEAVTQRRAGRWMLPRDERILIYSDYPDAAQDGGPETPKPTLP